eukprot:CAMPEP_0198226544 /NCGR_PEP_ID=MMETSP1445-20131203/105706_1 /TAXON_ID=36898 /ORGANISM="Pyramimonas sp., Strain CCMP2087" /LENGTH=87 /DNA_ID=CAMNT_0043906371 /DNA_START=105 /DNA_END=368 /DNA_ORIENTATION=-
MLVLQAHELAAMEQELGLYRLQVDGLVVALLGRVEVLTLLHLVRVETLQVEHLLLCLAALTLLRVDQQALEPLVQVLLIAVVLILLR